MFALLQVLLSKSTVLLRLKGTLSGLPRHHFLARRRQFTKLSQSASQALQPLNLSGLGLAWLNGSPSGEGVGQCQPAPSIDQGQCGASRESVAGQDLGSYSVC